MPSDSQGARVLKLASVCGSDSREVPPFHSSDFEIVSVSFSLETKVHPVAFPEEKVSEAKCKAVGRKHSLNISGLLEKNSWFYIQRPRDVLPENFCL